MTRNSPDGLMTFLVCAALFGVVLLVVAIKKRGKAEIGASLVWVAASGAGAVAFFNTTRDMLDVQQVAINAGVVALVVGALAAFAARKH